ncbi:calcium-binding protein [Rhizobium sp.]
MAMQKPSSQYESGTRVSLGTTDSVTVAKDVTLISSNYANTIVATGTGQAAVIAGVVVSLDLFGVTMGSGNNLSGKGHTVTVTKTGHIFGTGGDGGGIFLNGTGNAITNDGSVEGYEYGIFLRLGAGGVSTIDNGGVIRANTFAVWREGSASTETVVLKNTGVIEGGISSYGGPSVTHIGKDQITNTGRMIGDIYLNDGNDIYDGRKGTVDGDVRAGVGNDQLIGGKEDNVFFGDAGKDRIEGGLGADSLTGGADADQFIYKTTKDSTVKTNGRDTIFDFNQLENDRINLQAIDANTKLSGNQKFNFIDDASFNGKAGEVRFSHIDGKTLIQGDVNGDRKADFAILLDSEVDLGKGDFIL